MGFKTPSGATGSPHRPRAAQGTPHSPSSGATGSPHRPRAAQGAPSSPVAASGVPHDPSRKSLLAGGVTVRGPEVETFDLIQEQTVVSLGQQFSHQMELESDLSAVYQVSFNLTHESKPALVAQAVDQRILTQEETAPVFAPFQYTAVLEEEVAPRGEYQVGFRPMTEESQPSVTQNGVVTRTLTEEAGLRGGIWETVYGLRQEGILEIMPTLTVTRSTADVVMTTAFQDILSLTFVSQGGTVLFDGLVYGFDNGVALGNIELQIVRNTSALDRVGLGQVGIGAQRRVPIPVLYSDVPSAGSHTYKIQARDGTPSTALITGSFVPSYFAALEVR